MPRVGAMRRIDIERILFLLDKPSEPKLLAAPSVTGDNDSPDEKSICHECRQVDWDSLASQGERLRPGDVSLVVRTIRANHEQLATSLCKICRILSGLKPRSLDGTEYMVQAGSFADVSSTYSMPSSWPDCKTVGLHVRAGDKDALAVIRTDSLDFSLRTISPRLIDYNLLKRLAQSCEESHEDCGKPSSLGPVTGLKVIEASTRTIIEAPAECKYIALSYVWGKQPDISQIVTSYLQNPAPLIKDALSVTIAMGYKYLWVDKYCIPQTDNPERHRMINQMGQVYENACLTIIDASKGDDCVPSGLPGISSLTRRPQRCVYIRNTAILELPCGQDELICSKWATRGWTYQEGYFSKRRLIFTPSQILFLCNRSYAEESVCRLSQQIVTSSEFTRLFSFIDVDSMLEHQEELIYKLQEYSKRDLTLTKDSLNAFISVLNYEGDRSRRRGSPIFHIFGGLVVQRDFKNNSLRVFLTWYHKALAERRHEFPTWSWAGWGGPLKFEAATEGVMMYNPGKGESKLPHLKWEISWKTKDHGLVAIWEFVDIYWSIYCTTGPVQLHQQLDYPKRLEVTCFAVPIHFQVISLTEEKRNQETDICFEKTMTRTRVERRSLPSETVAVLQFVEGVHMGTKAWLDQKIYRQDSIIGLIYAKPLQDGSLPYVGCLLARQLNEGIYERVGAIPNLSYYEHDRDSSRIFVKFPQSAFLDNNGSILDEVSVSAAEERSLFCGVGERRTISLA